MKDALLQVEKVEEEYIPPRDSKNPLCPGSTRANGEVCHQPGHTVPLVGIAFIILEDEFNIGVM